MKNETRKELKTAHDQVAQLKAQIEALKTAAARAEESAADANAALEHHSGLEKAITRWRVSQLKNGGDTKRLPADLKARVDAKRDAEDELAQAQDALQEIASELNITRTKLRLANFAHEKEVIAVLHGSADELAAELEAINQRRAEIRQQLSGLAGIQLQLRDAGPAESIGMSKRAARAFNAGSDFDFPQHANADREQVIRWKLRFDALKADPDAAIVPPRPLCPADYMPTTHPRFANAPGFGWTVGLQGSWKPE